MAAIGRNEPCPCGSGKKYKQCHEPVDRAQADHVRLLRRAQDGLFSKLIEATQSETMLPQFGPAFEQYWQGAYSITDMAELDEQEDHGANRFLTWLAFDAADEAGTTLVERIAADPPAELELNDHERELLASWQPARLRPYVVVEILKGKGALVRDMLTGEERTLRDQAAAKRLEQEEMLMAHLVSVGDDYYIAGAASHMTPDTQEKMVEYLAIHQETWALQHPDVADSEFVRTNSHLFNHFVMALPREERVSKLDDLLLRGRVGLAMARGSLGFGPDDADDQADDDDQAADEADDADDDADEVADEFDDADDADDNAETSGADEFDDADDAASADPGPDAVGGTDPVAGGRFLG